MIDLKRLEKDSDYRQSCLDNLKNRKENASSLDPILTLNQDRKKLIFQIDTLIVERRTLEKQLSSSKGDKDLLQSAQKLGEAISSLQEKLKVTETKVTDAALLIPNICHKDVPISETKNKIIKQVGTTTSFKFKSQSHLDLTKEKGIDLERASKVTGARFSFLTGEIAQLERGLAHFMLDVHVKTNKYEEMYVPYIVNKKSLTNTSQLPKFKKDLFQIEGTEFFLIPTAEVPLINFFADEILKEKDLPIKIVACSPCFRSEAGSHGKNVKGLIRQHQFTKVELVVFSHPDKSYEELENLTSHAEMILQKLELPYQVVSLCTGDIGFAAAKCYDIEVWLPSEGAYREISSCSNCEDFQARRASIRFKGHSKPELIHTLNGSGLAVGRTLIALLENHQQEDGSIRIPKELQPYMDGKKTILNKK